jgi:hypothetical protein
MNIEAGNTTISKLETMMLEKVKAAANAGGRQELPEKIVKCYMDNS